MNLILIKFLTSLLLISCIYSIEFEDWIQNSKDLIFKKNQIVKISFNADIKGNNIQSYNQNNNCHIILNVSNSTYQIEFLDNIIHYSKNKMDHYNSNSHQFFRYKPDKIMVSFIEKITSNFLFDASKYRALNDSVFIYDKMINKTDFLKVVLDDNRIDVHYKNNVYDCTFSDIVFNALDKEKYNSMMLYSIIDTNNVEIFDFRQ